MCSSDLLFFANELRYRGRKEESVAEAKRALKSDPVSALANEQLADAYFSARQYDLAIEQYLKTLEMFPGRPSSLDNLGWAHVYVKMYDLGISEIEKSGEDPDLSSELAYVYAIRGDKARAENILKRLRQLSKEMPIAAHHFAIVYAGLNQRQQALEYLKKAHQEHSPVMRMLKVDARFDQLRSDPEFQNLMQRVGLAPEP